MGWREDSFQNDGPILAQYARENEHEGRAYRDPETLATYPSVTTVLKNSPKADLMRWAARIVAEKARDRPDIVMGDPDKVVDRLQYAPNDFRDERGWVGSGVHKAVEAELSGMFHVDEEFTREQERMMERFDEFLDQYEIVPILTECTVLIPCRDGASVMGTLDGFWRVTDRWTSESYVALADVKTSKRVWAEHEYQLSALAKASHWFEQVGEPGEGVLVHKHPKLGKTYWVKHEGYPFEIDQVRILHLREDFFAWELVSDIDENFEIFCDYVSLWNNLKSLKDKRKEIEFG